MLLGSMLRKVERKREEDELENLDLEVLNTSVDVAESMNVDDDWMNRVSIKVIAFTLSLLIKVMTNLVFNKYDGCEPTYKGTPSGAPLRF